MSLLVAAVVPLMAMMNGPATAQPAVSSLSQRQTLVTPAELFDIADKASLSGRPRLAERALRALTTNPDTLIRNEARYRLARLIAPMGREREAAVLLRHALDEEPNAAPVRLELAAMLHKMGDGPSALRELRALRSASLPSNVASFVDRLSARLQAAKPLGFQLELAIAPDTNINRATRSDTLGTVFGDFEVDEEAKARSGLGAALRGLSHVRLPISDRLQIVGRATGEANLYRHKEFNDITVEVGGGPEFQLGRTRVGLEAAAGQQWFGMKPYQRTFRFSATAVRPLGPVAQLRADGSVRLADNRRNDLQDGRGLSGRLRYERALSPRLMVAASIGADRFKAEDDAYSTRSWSGGVTAYRDMGQMTLITGVEVGRLRADERLALLPAARRDRLSRFQLGMVFRQLTFKGFAPIARVVVERNQSSVEFYDYKRTRTEFGVSRAF